MPPKKDSSKRKRSDLNSGDDAGDHIAKRPRVRERTSRQRDESERRLDALARLLEGSSQCVAIACFNDQCLVTANELKRSSREINQYIVHIKKVMRYFQRGVKLKGVDRIKFLQDIFIGYCKKSAKDLTIPEHLVQDVIQQVVTQPSEDTRFLKKYKTHLEAAGFVLASFARFYRDFCKVEESATQELKDFFGKKFSILRDVEEENVHAEIQLLEKIIRAISEKSLDEEAVLYFGISKLCCLHCYELLTAANEVFYAKNIKLKITFSGKHDLSFAQRWAMPALFVAAADQPMAIEDEEDDDDDDSPITSATVSAAKKLAVAIGQRAQEQISALLKLPTPKNVYQRTSISSGSETPRDVEHRLQAQKTNLQSMLETVKKLPYPEQRNIDILELGLNLVCKDFYETLIIQIENGKPPDPCKAFKNFSELLEESQQDMAKKFLTHVTFVGTEVASYFAPILADRKTPNLTKGRFFSSSTAHGAAAARAADDDSPSP